VISVARFVGDQLGQHQPQLAAVEHPLPSATLAPATPTASTTKAVSEAMAKPAPAAAMHRMPPVATAAFHFRIKKHCHSFE
ncbi:MAG: hypothetical protein KKB78_02290, partial [Alphaproteobacteria bacterium]|nr:hypothetical protein [Alphaproteobacteria bacterium]